MRCRGCCAVLVQAQVAQGELPATLEDLGY